MAWERIHGHDAVREQFRAAFARGRLGHAYLFAGPAGVGKKLFALELAKALLCESPPAALTACDRCPSCTLVTAGTHPDCTVTRKPDDKMEFPIDTIRELCGTLGLKATRGGRKVAILDDADDLNEEAANAFLKTLEEPPPGSILVLIASSSESQRATIRSRCQVVPFAPLAAAALANVLAENDIVDPAAADRLIRLAGGSPGRALALGDDAVWEFRGVLLHALGSPRIPSAALAAKWTEFVDTAAKEAQRERASVGLRLLADLLSRALHVAHGLGEEVEPAEAEKLGKFAAKVGVDGLVELIEKCLEADYWIDRRVPLPLVAEAVVEKLSRA